MQLSGDVTLLHKMHQLPLRLQKKHARAAVAKAARRLVKAAKQKCPQRTGQLRKSLGFKPRTYKAGVFAIVGPRSGFATVDENGKKHDPKKIAHLVEGGHGGPRAAPAHPFLRPAFDETSQSNIALIAAELARGVAEEVAKG